MPDVTLLEYPDYDTVLYILRNLRSFDQIEANAMSMSDDPIQWAAQIISSGPFQWVALYGEEPVATFGAVPRWPAVWSTWCLGTALFPHVALSVSRHIKRVMLPAVLMAGMQRADAFVVEDYQQAHRWMRTIGATREARLANWGKNGETFVSYIWLRET